MGLAGTAKVGDTLTVAEGVSLLVPDLPLRLPIKLQINTDAIRFRRVTANRVEFLITRGQPVVGAMRDLRQCPDPDKQPSC